MLRLSLIVQADPGKYPSQIVVDLLRLTGYLISKTFWFIRYHGRENIPDKSFGSFLIAANHQTYIDPVWICLPMRRRFAFMAVHQAFGWPVIGPLIAYLGAFPVSMEVGGTLRAMKRALKALRDGAALTVFPEGERAFEDGMLLEFKTGAVRIALQAGVPILPVTISGGNRIWPQKQRYPHLFRRVDLTYHPLLVVEESNELDARETLDQFTARLEEIIESSIVSPTLAKELR
jgi:1-acyl-sn-glycerol-3-phosphate acyltransferase